MFLTRFWTLLLVIASALSLAVALLARDVLNREREEAAASIVFKEYDKQEAGFSLFARKRLDVLMSLSDDADVRRYLAEASRSDKKEKANYAKLLTVLNRLNAKLGKYAADVVFAVNAQGDVVVTAGKKKRQAGFSLRGIPVVDDALRGYIRDDVIVLGKSVYAVAARPVIAGTAYVGAVIHAVELTDAFASGLSKTAQVVFFQDKRMLAVGRPSSPDVPAAAGSDVAGILTKLETDKNYQAKGHSGLLRLSSGGRDFVAALGKIRGDAAALGVGWGVVVPVDEQVEITSFFQQAGKQDIENLPWATVIGGAVLVLLLGLLWPYLEAERPIARLRRGIEALENADVKDQLNVYKYPRIVRKVAKAFNKVMDFKLRELSKSMGGAGKSVDAILGSADPQRMSSAQFRFTEEFDEVPPPSALTPPPPDATVSKKGAPAAAPQPPAAPGRPVTRPQRPLTPPAGGAVSGAHAAPSGGISPEAEEAHFRQVHKEFVALKQKLGEPTDQLSYERFAVTLKKNRDTLKARYGCQAVRFTVYEKDGKASLKAVPVK